MNIYIISGAILLLLLLWYTLRGSSGKEKSNTISTIHIDNEECCGKHQVCEKQKIAEARLNGKATYFEDEELDKYCNIDPSLYQDEDIEEFRYVLYTMQSDEVADWLESLSTRNIELPHQLKLEAYALINETK